MRVNNKANPPYLAGKHQSYADICDRCGAAINKVVQHYPAYWRSNRGCHQLRTIGIGIFYKGSAMPLDLCDTCAKELTEWMNHS